MAEAELERLSEERQKAEAHRDRVRTELDQAEAGLGAIDERMRSLRTLMGVGPEESDSTSVRAGATPRGEPVSGTAESVLSGQGLRRRAVEVRLLRDDASGPMHYRDWYELLRTEGLEVKGQRPDAVLLGQLTRSPVVKATTHSGFYEIDFQAPESLRARVEQLRATLATVATSARGTDRAALADQSEKRAAVVAELRRAERDLAEAADLLDTGEDERSAA